MRPLTRLSDQAHLRRGIILLGPAAAEEPLYLYHAARRLDRRLLATAQSVVVSIELGGPQADTAPLRQALDRFAVRNVDIVTIVPCFYPLGRALRQLIQQSVDEWQAVAGNNTACFLAGSFDQLLDLDMLIDLCLQTRSSGPLATSRSPQPPDRPPVGR